MFVWQSLILVAEFLLCLVFALLMYHTLGSYRHRPWYVTFFTLLGWVLCFYIVFLVPNDVAQAAQCPTEACTQNATGPCTDIIIVPENLVRVIWVVVYWVTLFLTWGVFPIMQTYSMTGEFTFGDKMRTSVKSNLLLYSVMGGVLIVVGIITIIELDIAWRSIPDTVSAAANAYGLFLLIAMLGHGLVNVPRRLWRRSRRELNLRRYQFDVALYDSKLFDCTESLKKTLKRVRKASEITPDTDPYRKYLDVIISKCPPDAYNAVPFGEGNIEISYSQLSILHEKVMREDHSVKLYRSLFNHSVREAIRAEDILNSKGNAEWKINWTNSAPRTGSLAQVLNVMEYFWFCYLQAPFYKFLCVLTIALSVVIVWSELLFGACSITWTKSSGATGHPPDLSVFSLYIRAMATDSPFLLQLFIFLPVIYIAWCAYSSLFQLRLFNYYHIVGHHMSDSNSLLFSAAYLCRLTAPMAYNFMQMAHYPNTEFVAVMGNLDVEGLEYKDTNVGHYFQLFFPVLLLPFILMTLFDVYSRIMGLLRIKRFQFTDDFDHSLIADGQEILNEERQRLSRGLGLERPEQTVLENQNPSLPPSDDLPRSYEESDSEGSFGNIPSYKESDDRERMPGSTGDIMEMGKQFKSRLFGFFGKESPADTTSEPRSEELEGPIRTRATRERMAAAQRAGDRNQSLPQSTPSLFSSRSRFDSTTERKKESLPTFNLRDDPNEDADLWKDLNL